MNLKCIGLSRRLATPLDNPFTTAWTARKRFQWYRSKWPNHKFWWSQWRYRYLQLMLANKSHCEIFTKLQHTWVGVCTRKLHVTSFECKLRHWDNKSESKRENKKWKFKCWEKREKCKWEWKWNQYLHSLLLRILGLRAQKNNWKHLLKSTRLPTGQYQKHLKAEMLW